jgi:hypothetical protein
MVDTVNHRDLEFSRPGGDYFIPFFGYDKDRQPEPIKDFKGQSVAAVATHRLLPVFVDVNHVIGKNAVEIKDDCAQPGGIDEGHTGNLTLPGVIVTRSL